MNRVVRILILPRALELVASGPARLIDLLDDLDPPGGLPTACRGGTCGVCLVHVTQGTELLEPASRRERERLGFAQATPDERYGCQLRLVEAAEGELTLVLSSSDESAGS